MVAAAFARWSPFEVLYKADAPAGQRLRLRGIISTEHRDLDEDRLLQDGLDFAPFMGQWGWLNDDHDERTPRVLGIPERIWPVWVPDETGKGQVKATAMEGYLLDDEEGRELFHKAQAAQKLGRHFGFSLHGDILERDDADPRTVTKAVVREVAITRAPKNPHTRLDVLEKSLTAIRKGMTVGYGRPATGAAVAGALAPVVPQSLEGAAPRFVVYVDPLAEDPDRVAAAYGRNASRHLTKAQAGASVRARFPGATEAQVRQVLRLARKLERMSG